MGHLQMLNAKHVFKSPTAQGIISFIYQRGNEAQRGKVLSYVVFELKFLTGLALERQRCWYFIWGISHTLLHSWSPEQPPSHLPLPIRGQPADQSQSSQSFILEANLCHRSKSHL